MEGLSSWEYRSGYGCDVRDAWKSLNTMMGKTQNAAKVQCLDTVTFAEELNTFYATFNDTDSGEDGVTYPSESICLDEQRVVSTSILSKFIERVVAEELTTMVGESLDPLQFTYKPRGDVEDASLALCDKAP